MSPFYNLQHHVMWADFLSHFTEIGNLEDSNAGNLPFHMRKPEPDVKPDVKKEEVQVVNDMPRPSVQLSGLQKMMEQEEYASKEPESEPKKEQRKPPVQASSYMMLSEEQEWSQ